MFTHHPFVDHPLLPSLPQFTHSWYNPMFSYLNALIYTNRHVIYQYLFTYIHQIIVCVAMRFVVYRLLVPLVYSVVLIFGFDVWIHLLSPTSSISHTTFLLVAFPLLLLLICSCYYIFIVVIIHRDWFSYIWIIYYGFTTLLFYGLSIICLFIRLMLITNIIIFATMFHSNGLDVLVKKTIIQYHIIRANIVVVNSSMLFFICLC
jgi:hypothetical protein